MGMDWEDHPPHPGIDLGAVFGAPSQRQTLFRVCVLRVPDGDSIPTPLTEFWRRVLTDGPPGCGAGWEVLVVENWPDSGGFRVAFSRADLCDDEPPVFKFASVEIERRWYELPDTDDPAFDAAADALEQRWIGLLAQAARSAPAATLLACLRRSHPVPVWLANQTGSRHCVLEV
jgi:hypothetical protein